MIVTENSRMINLLDPAAKRDLRAARLNIVLITYCLIVAIGLVCVLLLFVFSNSWLDKRIAAAKTEQASNYAQAQTGADKEVLREAQSFSDNLNKIQAVLNNRSHFSTALLNIAASLPAGATIGQTTLSSTFITTPLEVTAMTDTNQTALALKAQLSTSPLYSKVVLNSVNCGGTNGPGCAVTLTVTMSQAVFTEGAKQ